jgi:hypothetical protein
VTSYNSGLFKVTTAVKGRQCSGVAVRQPSELGSTGTRIDGKGVLEFGLWGRGGDYNFIFKDI